ncbi:MAG: hypothetical protein ACE14S_09190 [Candidatus Bathyarchaeia archaeon]
MKRIVSPDLQKTLTRLVHVRTATDQNKLAVQTGVSSDAGYWKEDRAAIAEIELRKAEAQAASCRRPFL